MNDDLLKPLIAPDFFLCTSPEMDALERAAADGKHGLHYVTEPQTPARVHQIAGASHFVRLEGESGEEETEASAKLEALSGAQDADATLAFLYISHLLAPPAPLPANATAVGWIEFDDVIAKIGWNPRSTAERQEMRARLYNFVLFAERAQVIGERSVKYFDKSTGAEIDTKIRAALWRISKTQMPDQGTLFPESRVPVRVEVMIAREWAQLLTQPATAQYLPMGELLGNIPGNKPSGAWARVLGLSLASFWRRQPKAALDGSIQPTRRELLERYPPKTGAVAEVLDGPNPQYAITYWCGALQILVECGFLKAEGEAITTPDEMREALPRQGWADQWLNTRTLLQPGTAFGETIVQRAAALPAPTTPKKKRGRPRKQAG